MDKIEFIKEAHRGQKYGEEDYFYHLEKTAEVATRFSPTYPFLADSAVQIACYGHDILEDTPTTIPDLVKAGFPLRAVKIIEKVTDVPGKNRKERKKATYPKIHGNIEATAVKLCDRIANVENCIRTKDIGKLEMYRREHKEMEEALRIGNQLDSLWLHLSGLFSISKNLVNNLQ